MYNKNSTSKHITKEIISLILIFVLLCSSLNVVNVKASVIANSIITKTTKATSNTTEKNFIYVSGQKLYDANGKEFQIKSIGFGNNVWYTQKGIPSTDHDEQSYEELADLGFNAVRFYINANLFESDSDPYKYNEEAFNWLSENAQWARKYNIKILINMHIPQGGQLNSSSVNLWVKEGYKERFVALWKEIAKRFSDEDAILGYGLLNEPFVPECSTKEEALNLYYDLMDKTTAEIREVDQNHMLFLERPYGMVNTAKKQINYWGYTDSYRVIKDNNTVYEFHFYDKNEYVFQSISWLSNRSKWLYNSDKIAILAGSRSVSKTYISDSTQKYNTTSDSWQYIESNYIASTNKEANYGYWMLYTSKLGNSGTLLADDIVVKEYNKKGEFVRNLYELNFNNTTACDGWDLGTSGRGAYSYNSSEGNTELGCAQIAGVRKSYRIYKSNNADNYFPIKAGYSYKICAYVKFNSANTDSTVNLALQACHAENIYALDSTYLRSRLEVFLNWGRTNNVPMYLGEFGVPNQLMGNEYKGEVWVSDMFDLLNEYDLGYCYHDYHEENFGLYMNDSRYERTVRNEILYQLFEAKVK